MGQTLQEDKCSKEDSFNTNPVDGFVGINLYVLSQMTLMEILGLLITFLIT